MARYFVHIDDGAPLPDLEGSEFTSLAGVETAVRDSLVEMMADASLARRVFAIKIDVQDENGHVVMSGQVDFKLTVHPMFAGGIDTKSH